MHLPKGISAVNFILKLTIEALEQGVEICSLAFWFLYR